MNDHDNDMHTSGGDERSLDDLLVGALAGRSGQARPGSGSIRDVRLRARRHARRRTAVGGGMIIAVGALGVVYAGRGDDGSGPRIATGDGAGTPSGAGDAGSLGPWECTGLIGTSLDGGPLPVPTPTTTSPPYDGAMTTVPHEEVFTTTSILGDGTVTSTTVTGDGTVMITAPLAGIASSTVPVGDDVASSTTASPVTTIVLPTMVYTTVPAGVEVVPADTTVGPEVTYTLQSCTFVGTVDPTLDSSAADEGRDAAAAAARLAALEAQVAALRAELARQGIDTTIPAITVPPADASGTTVSATFDPGDTVPAILEPGATVPAIRVDDTTAAGG